MFVNKLFTYAHVSKNKRYSNVRYSAYCFHCEDEIQADFQVYISVPLWHFFLQDQNSRQKFKYLENEKRF